MKILTIISLCSLSLSFRFGKHYEIPLLLQSILMNATMLLMIKVCVNIRNKNQITKSKEQVFTGESLSFTLTHTL